MSYVENTGTKETDMTNKDRIHFTSLEAKTPAQRHREAAEAQTWLDRVSTSTVLYADMDHKEDQVWSGQ
jgi:hypothetical protein